MAREMKTRGNVNNAYACSLISLLCKRSEAGTAVLLLGRCCCNTIRAQSPAICIANINMKLAAHEASLRIAAELESSH